MKVIIKLVLWSRVLWHNFIYRKDINDYPVEEKIRKNALSKDLSEILSKVYKRFTYKYDSIDVAFDAMHKPAEAYKMYKENEFKDDCDGYAACISHILAKNGFDPIILTYIPTKIKEGHTICYFEYNNKCYLIDYTSLYMNTTLEECLNDLSEDRKVDIITYITSKFDYKENKYKVI